MIAWGSSAKSGSQFLDVNAIMVEHVEQIFFQIRLPVLFLHLTDDSLRRGRTEELSSNKRSRPNSRSRRISCRASLVFSRRPASSCSAVSGSATGNSRARSWTPRPNWRSSSLPLPDCFQRRSNRRDTTAPILPAGCGQDTDMNLDVGGLTDSIQPSDALFEQSGFSGRSNRTRCCAN